MIYAMSIRKALSFAESSRSTTFVPGAWHKSQKKCCHRSDIPPGGVSEYDRAWPQGCDKGSFELKIPPPGGDWSALGIYNRGLRLAKPTRAE